MRFLLTALLSLLVAPDAAAVVGCTERLASLGLAFELRRVQAVVELSSARAEASTTASQVLEQVRAGRRLTGSKDWKCSKSTLGEYPAERCDRRGGDSSLQLTVWIGANDGIELVARRDSAPGQGVAHQILVSYLPEGKGRWERRESYSSTLYQANTAFTLITSNASRGFTDLPRFERALAPECFDPNCPTN
jgi:hypothetical protein